MTELTTIYRARDVIQANLIKGALEDAGIRVEVTGGYLDAGLGGGALGWAAEPEILVHDTDADRAKAIIRDLESSRPGKAAD